MPWKEDPSKHRSILVLPDQLVEEKTLYTNRDDNLEVTKIVWILDDRYRWICDKIIED